MGNVTGKHQNARSQWLDIRQELGPPLPVSVTREVFDAITLGDEWPPPKQYPCCKGDGCDVCRPVAREAKSPCCKSCHGDGCGSCKATPSPCLNVEREEPLVVLRRIARENDLTIEIRFKGD